MKNYPINNTKSPFDEDFEDSFG